MLAAGARCPWVRGWTLDKLYLAPHLGFGGILGRTHITPGTRVGCSRRRENYHLEDKTNALLTTFLSAIRHHTAHEREITRLSPKGNMYPIGKAFLIVQEINNREQMRKSGEKRTTDTSIKKRSLFSRTSPTAARCTAATSARCTTETTASATRDSSTVTCPVGVTRRSRTSRIVVVVRRIRSRRRL